MPATVSVALINIENHLLGGLVANIGRDVPLEPGVNLTSLSTGASTLFAAPSKGETPLGSLWRVSVYGGPIRWAASAVDPSLTAGAGELLGPGLYHFSATPGTKFWAIDATTN